MRRLALVVFAALALTGCPSDGDERERAAAPTTSMPSTTTTTAASGCDGLGQPAGFTIEILGPPVPFKPNVVVTPGRMVVHVDRASDPIALRMTLSESDYSDLMAHACTQREIENSEDSVGYNAWVTITGPSGAKLRTRDVSGEPELGATPLGSAINRITQSRCAAVALPDTPPSQKAVRRCA